MDEARLPLGVLPFSVSSDGSDATLMLWTDEKPATSHWIVEAESTWLTADSDVFEKPIAQAAEDVNGSPGARVVSCTLLLFMCVCVNDTVSSIRVAPKVLYGMSSTHACEQSTIGRNDTCIIEETLSEYT